MENYHLVDDDGEWKLKREGADRATKAFGDKTKLEAIRESAEYLGSHPGSLKIHKQDGTIQEERTYPRSADPKQSPG